MIIGTKKRQCQNEHIHSPGLSGGDRIGVVPDHRMVFGCKTLDYMAVAEQNIDLDPDLVAAAGVVANIVVVAVAVQDIQVVGRRGREGHRRRLLPFLLPTA